MVSGVSDGRWNPVPEHFLPEGFLLREDEDFAYVVCSLCGHHSILSVPAATPEVLVAAAHAHTCHEERR